jgi:hypothetical protein
MKKQVKNQSSHRVNLPNKKGKIKISLTDSLFRTMRSHRPSLTRSDAETEFSRAVAVWNSTLSDRNEFIRWAFIASMDAQSPPDVDWIFSEDKFPTLPSYHCFRSIMHRTGTRGWLFSIEFDNRIDVCFTINMVDKYLESI